MYVQSWIPASDVRACVYLWVQVCSSDVCTCVSVSVYICEYRMDVHVPTAPMGLQALQLLEAFFRCVCACLSFGLCACLAFDCGHASLHVCMHVLLFVCVHPLF